LCALFGKTRHAFYDNQRREKDQLLKDEIILQLVQQIRSSLPRIGVRKLCHMIKPRLLEHGLDIGRDYLFNLLATHKLLVRTRKRKVVTTQSNHWMRKYHNLIKDVQVNRPEQVWVSDITYIRLSNGFAYLSLITDAYSRKIVGYHLRRDLSSEGCMHALKMSLQSRSSRESLIHHSDRGSQYCCRAYVDELVKHNVAISMTENGDPYENALAERVNGIIKAEFNLYSSHLSFEETCKSVKKSIEAYNNLRPHASCDYLVPEDAHRSTGVLKKRWKNYNQPTLTDP
jgi:putative transposase